MHNRLTEYSSLEIQLIHQATLKILERAGVSFPGGPALELFREHGFKVEGELVFITEEQLLKHLATVPRMVNLVARNPEKSLVLGGDNPVFIGTTGPPKLLMPNGEMRDGTLEDYENFQKLSQTSKLPQGASYKAVYPQNIPARSAHLDMLFRSLTLTDYFAGGDSQEEVNTRDTLNMMGIVFGGSDFLRQNTVVRVTISVLTPLRYAPEQSASLIMLAENNQLAVISNMAMMGSTSPLDFRQSLALGNAEILAGIVLSQLARPGAPVIYGSTSCPLEMKGMAATLGSPETLWFSHGAVSLARHYGVPSRTGGGLNDSFLVDGQCLAEAALVLNRALGSGADCIMHAFGMMGGYIGASLEKWVLDEEIAAFILASLNQPRFDGDIDVEEIVRLGPGANYMVQPSTMKNFRSLFRFDVFNKLPLDMWRKKGGRDILAAAEAEVRRRLSLYEKPAIDPRMEAALADYVERRRRELLP